MEDNTTYGANILKRCLSQLFYSVSDIHTFTVSITEIQIGGLICTQLPEMEIKINKHPK
jgi:hypothetical protein